MLLLGYPDRAGFDSKTRLQANSYTDLCPGRQSRTELNIVALLSSRGRSVAKRAIEYASTNARSWTFSRQPSNISQKTQC
jgi:hypothetical protein